MASAAAPVQRRLIPGDYAQDIARFKDTLSKFLGFAGPRLRRARPLHVTLADTSSLVRTRTSAAADSPPTGALATASAPGNMLARTESTTAAEELKQAKEVLEQAKVGLAEEISLSRNVPAPGNTLARTESSTAAEFEELKPAQVGMAEEISLSKIVRNVSERVLGSEAQARLPLHPDVTAAQDHDQRRAAH